MKTGMEDKINREIEKVTLSVLRSCTDLNEFTDKVISELMVHFGVCAFTRASMPSRECDHSD